MKMDINLFLTSTPHIDCGFCCSTIHLLIENQENPIPKKAALGKIHRPTNTTTTWDSKTGLRTDVIRELSDEEIKENFRRAHLEGDIL